MAGTFSSLNGDVDFSTFTSRGFAGNHASSPQAPNGSSSNDARASLTRRFTTNTVPTLPTLGSMSSPLSPIGQARRQAAESSDLSSATFHKVQLLEKKRLEYEFLKEQRRRFQTEMELLDLQARNQESEMLRLSGEVNRISLNGQPQTVPKSEPTTPPEYRDNNGFSSAFPRPNRFSTSSMQALQSPPGFQTSLAAHPHRHSTHLPPSRLHSQTISHVPSKSVPGSRRNSDEEEDEYDYTLATMNPRPAQLNRNSMPVTGYDLRALSESPAFQDTTSFLFKDEDDSQMSKPRKSIASPERRSFFRTVPEKDNFPVLIRGNDGDGFPQISALDLAPLSQSPGPESNNAGWYSSHRPGQKSLPMNSIRNFNQSDDFETSSSATNSTTVAIETPTKSSFATGNNRRSMEVKFSPFTESKRSSLLTSPGSSTGMPRLQSSYSTNDIPTLKSTNAFGSPANVANSGSETPKKHADQHFHNHNASLGRIPVGAVSNRHSRDLSGVDVRSEEKAKPQFRQLQSALQASAAPFGPAMTSSSTTSPTPAFTTSPPLSQYASPAYYGGYGMQMLNNGANNVNGPSQPQQQAGNQVPFFSGSYTPYTQMSQVYAQYNSTRLPDSQARVMQQRRLPSGDDHARYASLAFSEVEGQILELCKDQHGCRYLQKRLEERDPKTIQSIFNETNEHVVELMTDPFGNYLCQKLLEFTNDEQRTALINNAAPSMVKIALNQHGTRALQKMIEFISTPEQIATIIRALKDQVVELIQDLNGNHVIQKCLNHLTTLDAQFIFEAVGAYCVVVGTHRHGCCVLQRCIDHASDTQKAHLVAQITECAFPLVQDPFGNYVVQYILDLNEPSFIKPLCYKFRGSIPALSKQKFSSNVIEKCIRVADMDTKRVMVEEMLDATELDKMLRDAFANYVVQTALEYTDADTRNRLIDALSPHLPAIRNTPYGRRIMSKIQDSGRRSLPAGSNPMTPQEIMSPPSSQGQMYPHPPAPANVYAPPPNPQAGPVNGYGYTSSIASPQPHRLSNPPLPAHLQATVTSNFPTSGRMGQFF